MTAKWEAYLRKIGNGEGTPQRFLGSIAKFIYKLLEEVPGQLNSQTDKLISLAPSTTSNTFSNQAGRPVSYM